MLVALIALALTALIAVFLFIAVTRIQQQTRDRSPVIVAVLFALVLVIIVWAIALSFGPSQVASTHTASAPAPDPVKTVDVQSQTETSPPARPVTPPCLPVGSRKISLSGPRHVGPSLKDQATYQVRGALITRVVFYVNAVQRKDDRHAPFNYKTRAHSLKTNNGRTFGLLRLRVKVFYNTCSPSRAREMNIRRLKPQPVRRPKPKPIIVVPIRPAPVVRPAPAAQRRPASAVPRPASPPKKRKPKTFTYDLGG